MLQLDIMQLVTAVQEAAPFALPEMNNGTSYLYNNIYKRLSRGGDVRLSDLNFSAFNSDDITALSELYENVFESNNHRSNSIVDILRKTTPVCKASTYV